MKQYFLILSLIIFGFTSFSQDVITKKCGISNYLNNQIGKDPDLVPRMALHEENLKQWIIKYKLKKSADQTITIPVVFHVIYNKDDENISNARIYSQLDVLNEDYRKLNSDASRVPEIFMSVAADCNIEFCLAQRDPDGNHTSGIISNRIHIIRSI